VNKEMSKNYDSAVVIDNGTVFSKIGFAGEDQPRAIIQTLPRSPIKIEPPKSRETLIKKKPPPIPIREKGFLEGVSPMKRGVIKDWDAMIRFWGYCFYKMLKINPSEHPVILTEPALNTKENRNKMMEIMFEEFDVPAVYIGMQNVLSLYATGRTTGCVINSGESATDIVPICDNYVNDQTVQKIDLAGGHITKFLQKLMRQAGYSLITEQEKRVLVDIKENYCYIAEDFEGEITRAKNNNKIQKEHLAPDGNKISISIERFTAPEAIFNPSIMGKELPTLHEALYKAINESDIHYRKDLFNNIILSGGNTLFPGLKERLSRELKKIIPETVNIRIIAPEDRILTTWYGGSLLGALPSFTDLATKKQHYQELMEKSP
jgi:actin-related protein